MALTDSKTRPGAISEFPFAITESQTVTGAYYVDRGVCFSSFSFETGSFVPIKGLGSGFNYKLEENKKLYIDLKILPNLQVSGASIECNEVGDDSEYWKNYPNMIEFKPVDEVDENGRVTKIVDNKKQTNCYILIGYNAEDTSKNGIESPVPDGVTSEPVQILDTNIILLASVVSGVPVVFPAPYFNGLQHLIATEDPLSL